MADNVAPQHTTLRTTIHLARKALTCISEEVIRRPMEQLTPPDISTLHGSSNIVFFRRFVDWFWVLLSYHKLSNSGFVSSFEKYGHQVAVQFCRARVDARGRRMGWDGGGIRQQKSEQLFFVFFWNG